MSPSAIMKLLNCPFDYYYRYIKRLPDINYPSLNVHKSLEANTKGTFFHKIMEEYAKRAFKIDNFKNKFDDDVFSLALPGIRKGPDLRRLQDRALLPEMRNSAGFSRSSTGLQRCKSYYYYCKIQEKGCR